MRDAPCRNCTERHMNCHASCEEYKNWRVEYDEYARKVADKQRVDRCIVAEKRAIIYSKRNRNSRNKR